MRHAFQVLSERFTKDELSKITFVSYYIANYGRQSNKINNVYNNGPL